MWDQLTTFWSLDRAEKHYSLKEQPLNMPLGIQNPMQKGPISVWPHGGYQSEENVFCQHVVMS